MPDLVTAVPPTVTVTPPPVVPTTSTAQPTATAVKVAVPTVPSSQPTATAAPLAAPTSVEVIKPTRVPTTTPTPTRTTTLIARPPTNPRGRDGFFVGLDYPQIVPAERATFLDPSELVLGLELGGEARAYPARMAWYHHVFNDELGGVPALVTY